MRFFSVSSSARYLTRKGRDRGFNISSELFFFGGENRFSNRFKSKAVEKGRLRDLLKRIYLQMQILKFNKVLTLSSINHHSGKCLFFLCGKKPGFA